MFDDVLYDATRPSLRIAPLQDPFPPLCSSSNRPSPLEPEAYVNISSDANKLTGRRKALAQAKSLDAPEPDEWDTLINSKTETDFTVVEADSIHETPRKKQKLRSYDHEQNAEFVQLPKPPTKAKLVKPRPFQPISILNELHEPPPSAALFPPITPNANQAEGQDIVVEKLSSRIKNEERQASAKGGKPNGDSTVPNIATRKYKRGRTRWTQEEIDHLIKGVTIYGIGRWKNILEHPDLHFREGRTPTDLKDRSVNSMYHFTSLSSETDGTRFRVCFPPHAKSKDCAPLPKKIEFADGNSKIFPPCT